MASHDDRTWTTLAERGRVRGPDAVLAAARSKVDPAQPDLEPVRRRSHGWVFAAAAAMLAVVLIGSAAWLFGGGDVGSSVADSSATAPQAPTSAAPTTVPGEETNVVTTIATSGDPGIVAVVESGPLWVSARDVAGVFPTGHTAVDGVRFGSMLVAAGYSEMDVPRAAVWTSVDGMTWGTSGFDFPGDTRIRGIATDGELLVAVGTSFDDDPSGHDRAAVWTSVDAMSWDRVGQTDGSFLPGSALTSVTWGPPFVAAGFTPVEVTLESGEMGLEGRPAVWVSEDGQVWTPSSFPIAGDMDEIIAVAARESGFVAVGRSTDPEDPMMAAGAVWVSVDGMSWSPVTDLPLTDPLDETCRVIDLTGIAAGPAGLLASGVCGGTDADEGIPTMVLWMSPDGVEWTWAAYPADVDRLGWIVDVLVTEEGFRAVGGLVVPGETWPSTVSWYSPDGLTWVLQQDEV